MKRLFLFTSLIYFSFSALTQINEQFIDGDFSLSPTWTGDDSVFTIFNNAGNNQLRSNKTLTNSTYYLSTPSTNISNTQWEFFTQLQFNTSSANYVDIYLTADNSNLLNASLSAYFVRIGGTTDEISLYKKISGSNTKIIDGLDGITNFSNNTLKIKVVCSAAGDWTLSRDNTGTGSNYVSEGTINDNSITTSTHFGISITHSTASFFQKHFFDDFYVGPIIFDVTPPILNSATAISATQVDVLFNENLDPTSAQLISNYSLNPSVGISSASLDGSNQALVHLQLASSMTNGTTYTLTSNNIEDVSNNASSIQNSNFQYLVNDTPTKGDVIITEMMVDPSPKVGLPEVEYIEIHNKSNKIFNLNSWKISDGPSIGTISNTWILPNEYKVLCTSSYVDSFPNSIAVSSFPSFANAGDSVILISDLGVKIDQVIYTDIWYKDDSKKNGGYSLELINPLHPCSGESNWMASSAIIGGTPGNQNSVYNTNPDVTLPQIISVNAYAPDYLQVNFNKGMDSLSLVNSTIVTTPNLTVNQKFIAGSSPTQIMFEFNEAITASSIYQFVLNDVADCWLNTADLTGQFILTENIAQGDIIINEIMFAPKSGGSDWIEVYNSSEKYLDLKNITFANYDDSIANFKSINQSFILAPHQYKVIGKDSVHVLANYPAYTAGTFIKSDLPSYNSDSSTVYLLYNQQVLDKVSYSDDWHFKLLDETSGVSLERISFSNASNDKNNWHSAAQNIGFATPGTKNSQYYPATENGNFSYTSETISPDNDGFEDVLLLAYEMNEPGLLATFTIYDDKGRLVKTLFKNELLATKGVFSWDGITDENIKASIGTYIGLFEAFSISNGLVYTQRKTFVVAGKL